MLAGDRLPAEGVSVGNSDEGSLVALSSDRQVKVDEFGNLSEATLVGLLIAQAAFTSAPKLVLISFRCSASSVVSLSRVSWSWR